MKVVPPPLIFFFLILVGLALHIVIPPTIKIHSTLVRMFAVLTLTGLSGIIAFQSFRVMRRYKTDITFRQPTTTLVDKGPFRLTRNPLYVSLLLLYAGIGVLLNSVWFVPLFFVLFGSLQKVILREEKYLDSLYGEKFQNYKNSVRRWF